MPEETQSGGPPQFDESVIQVLASKIFADWLRNRQQLLVPLTLDLRKLETPHAELLVQAMAAAAHADGVPDHNARTRLDAALQRLNAGDDHRAALESAISQARPLHDLLADVRDVQMGAQVYAASAIAIDRRNRVNRYYLRYLAARLRLPSALTRSVEQRFASGS